MEKTTKELINALASGPVRKYLTDHEHDDVRSAILKNKEILGIPTARLFDQITIRKKAKEKLPAYYHNPDVVYPPAVNFEQSSSEWTALYKSSIIQELLAEKKGKEGADLTGGFGVDTYFLSRKVDRLYYVEPDQSLQEIARHNHTLLHATNIEYHVTTAEDFIRNTGRSFDFIFADPSRRTRSGEKIHALGDTQPDLLKILPTIFSRTRILMVKASPLLDIQAACSMIPHVRAVHVISVNNECKELVFISEKDFNGIPRIHAVDINNALSGDSFIFTIPEEREIKSEFSDPGAYLYEPNASILKAGAFKTLAVRFNLKKLHSSTHLYTADELVKSFPGRKFAVEALVRPDPAEMKKYFPEGKANVTTRNYPLSPDELKKKMRLKDGGEKFLIAFSGTSKKFLAVANRI